MQTTIRCEHPSRRRFLKLLGGGAIGLAMPGARLLSAPRSESKPLRGIFPIAQTPFTEADKLDLDALAEQVRFIDRGGVHGFVWPQMASEWSSLSDRERLDGAEAIASTGKALRPAIVIGVQAPDVATAVKYARHAERVGADAIISLPPSGQSDPKVILDYYKEVGGATELPLFVQSSGDMNVEALLDIHKTVPTMRYVKDEAGQPIQRIAPLRRGSDDRIKVFSGGHGRTLTEEMRRGSSGSMPAASFADLYAQTWDLWHAGKHREAMAMHARTLLILTEMGIHGSEAMKYILYARGVFKTYSVRRQGRHIDEAGKKALRETLDFLKPHLRA